LVDREEGGKKTIYPKDRYGWGRRTENISRPRNATARGVSPVLEEGQRLDLKKEGGQIATKSDQRGGGRTKEFSVSKKKKEHRPEPRDEEKIER